MAQAVQPFPLLRRAARMPPAVAYGIRLGVVVAAAIWLGKAPGLVENNPQWILITVLMVMQPQTGGSLLKGLLRAVGTAAAAFTAILLFGVGAQTPPLLVAGLFAVQAIAGYGNSGRRFQYAWFVWAFTTAIVLGSAMAGEDDVETIAFQRASMVGMGILLVFVVDSLLWPERSEPSLRESLAGRARELGEALRRAIAARRPPEMAQADRQVLANQLQLVDGVRHELGVSRARADALARVALLLEGLASHARALATGFELPAGLEARSRDLLDALDALAGRVRAALAELARALTESRAPAPFAAELEQTLLVLEAERERLVEQAGWSAALEGRAAVLRDLVAVLRTLEETVSSSERPPDETGAGATRLRLDPFRVKIALRTGVAVVAAFLIPMVLGWPINTMVAPMAFMVAAFNRGAALQALALLAGIVALSWLLADLALVFLMPHVGRAPLALLYAFGVASVFAYVRWHRPQLALLPSIGGLLAILPVYGGLAPPTDVYGTYNTTCYVALGLGTGWLASRLLWPATASELLRQRVAAQLALCAQRITSASEVSAMRFVRAGGESAAQLGALHRQAGLEPVEHALDGERRAVLLGLVADLNDAALGFQPGWPPALAELGEDARGLLEALERLDAACVESLESAVATLTDQGGAAPPDLSRVSQEVEERVAEVRARRMALPSVSDAQRRDFLVRIGSRRRLLNRLGVLETWVADWQKALEGPDSRV